MMNGKPFADKIVLISGGATGLGLAMAKKIGSYGATMVILSRNEERLNEAVESMKKEGINAHYYVCDVKDHEKVEETVQDIWKGLGPINCLINNAAGNFISRTEDLSVKAFESVIGIVLMGTIHLSLSVGKMWIKEKMKGNILNITTTYSWTGSGYVTPSAAAKGGVTAFTRSLASEWGSKGIRVNAIAPGPFKTEGAWKRLVPTEMVEKEMTKRVPLGRLGQPEEISELAAYLLSDYSGYINGDIVTIDGGEWIYGGGQFNQLSTLPDEFWESLKESRKKIRSS
jgi:NAD(P)-dependent dehydrogenase (short-subunit alcohol dehydrogenase family)